MKHQSLAFILYYRVICKDICHLCITIWPLSSVYESVTDDIKALHIQSFYRFLGFILHVSEIYLAE